MTVRVAIVSDFICPWCFIGKRRLDIAARQLGIALCVDWMPFVLLPATPKGGMPFARALELMFGRPVDARAAFTTVANQGRDAGIAFSFDRLDWLPSTIAAHRLIAAVPKDRTHDLADRLFSARFEHGMDIGDPDVLCAEAATLGICRADAERIIDSDGSRPEMEDRMFAPRPAGVTGVPVMTVGARSVVGARSIDDYRALLRAAAPAGDS